MALEFEGELPSASGLSSCLGLPLASISAICVLIFFFSYATATLAPISGDNAILQVWISTLMTHPCLQQHPEAMSDIQGQLSGMPFHRTSLVNANPHLQVLQQHPVIQIGFSQRCT